MKSFVVMLVLICSCVCVYGQQQKTSNCILQDLAIAAALGDPNAQYNLGVQFHRGESVPQDLAKAAELWRLASKAGIIEAFNNLGHLKYYGRGIKQDRAEGVRLWRVAATKGLNESQIHLAFAYSDGLYLRPDYIEAYAWALTGKHFAEQEDEPENRKALLEMADDALNTIGKHMSSIQLVAAKKRAALYIVRYAPKEGWVLVRPRRIKLKQSSRTHGDIWR